LRGLASADVVHSELGAAGVGSVRWRRSRPYVRWR